MPTPAIPLDIPFGPLDTKTDPFSLPPGSLTIAENVTSVTPKSYKGRRGYAGLTTTGGPSAAVNAFLRGTELLVSDGQQIYAYDSDKTEWLTPHTVISEAAVTRRPFLQELQVIAARPSMAIANGITVVAYLQGSGGAIFVRCTNASGQILKTATLNVGGTFDYVNVRAVANGNTVVVFGLRTATARVDAYRCDTSSLPLTWSAGTNISVSVHATSIILDAWAVGSDIALIWASAAGITTALVNPTTLAVSVSLGQAATLTANSGGAITGTSAENIYAAWWDSVLGLKVWVLTTALVSSSGPTVVDAYVTTGIRQVGFTRIDATHVLTAWHRSATSTTLRGDGVARDKIRWASVSNVVAVGTITDIDAVSLLSKPFSNSGFYYVLGFFDSTQNQASTFLVRIRSDGAGSASTNYGPSMATAMANYRQAARDTVASSLLDIVQESAGVFTAATLVAIKSIAQNTPTNTIYLSSFDLGTGRRNIATELGKVAYVAGGLGTQYDGTIATELQFTTFPEGLALTPATAGGSMADGTYQYIAIFEWTDNQGNVHQSTTSIPKSATISGGGGAGKVTIASLASEPVVSLRQTGFGSPAPGAVRYGLFRTAPSVSTGIYYEASTGSMAPGTGAVTIVDTLADASISANRQIYITGGALDKECPPSCSLLITHQNALWGVSSEDAQLLFYSGDFFLGVAPWFSSGFQIRCDMGGAITALASLDDKVIVFKNDRIFYISGNRPNATGTGSSLSNPQLVSTDAGCIEPRSIVRTGDGIYFLAQKGIYLLDRGLNVSYVGSPVEAYVSHYTNSVSATLMPELQEIRWEFTGPLSGIPSPSVARKVVYNYLTKNWTTHLNYNSLVPVTATGGIGVRYTWFTSAGVGYQELAETSQQVDPSTTYIPITIQSGWLAPTGPQGLTRVQYILLLSSYLGAHSTTLTYYKDYDESAAGSRSYSNATIIAAGKNLSYNLPNQQGESFRVKVTTSADGSSGSYGQSMAATGIRLVAIPKRGSFNKFMGVSGKG